VTDVAGLLATLGITNYLTKEVARKGIAGRGEVLNALALRVPLTVVACTVAVMAATLLGYEPAIRQLIYVLCLNIVLSGIAGVLVGALQGLQEIRVGAAIDAVSKVVMLASASFFLLHGYGVLGVAMAGNLAGLTNVAGCLIALLRRRSVGGRLDFRLWRQILSGSLPFFVWQSALMIYGQIDVVMLSFLTRAAVVGWYTAAYRIISITIFAPVIVAGVVFPALSSSATRDFAEFRAIARRSLHVVLWLTIPVALGTIVIARPMLDFLHYPEAFRKSVPLIMILALHVPMLGADMIIGSAVNALDKQRLWALTGIAAAVFNPSLNLILIPFCDRAYGNGAIGAATATVLTEAFMMSAGLYLLRGKVFDSTTLVDALKCLAAGLVMMGAVLPLRDASLPLVVLLGALVYGAASVCLGTISMRDVRLLRLYVFSSRAAGAAA
jgi:O-antigen/teichoic acid export membrane protein